MSSEQSILCAVCIEECKENLTCGSCNTTYCIECSQQYLLTVDEAHCMGCKKAWDARFLRDKFNKNWMNKTYKNKQKDVLFKKEVTFIPATMMLVERTNRYKQDLYTYYNALSIDNHYNEQINTLKKEQTLLTVSNAVQNKKRLQEIKLSIQKLTKEKGKHITLRIPNKPDLDVNTVERIGPRGRIYYTRENGKEEQKEKAIIHIKCPIDSCLGYIDDKYHCSACNNTICKKCNQKTNTSHSHTCKPEDIKTVQYLHSNTKACPKCGIRTSKIDGCDSMWCVDCKTSWNWKTGLIESGPIHNPEYFRYMRERGLTVPVRPDNPNGNQNVFQNGCVNQADFEMLSIQLFSINTPIVFTFGPYKIDSLYKFVQNLFRWLYNFRTGIRGDTSVGIRTREELTFDTFKEDRIKYILKNISEDEFKTKLTRKAREIEYKNMIFSLCDTLSHIIEDALRRFQEFMRRALSTHLHKPLNEKDIPDDIFTELIHYIDYFNEECKSIATLFGYRTYYKTTISTEFNSIHIIKPKETKQTVDSDEE